MKEKSKSELLYLKDREYISGCLHAVQFPFAVRKARGCILEDPDGRKYIDFLSSASSLNLGSSNRGVLKAVRKQLKRTTQYSIVYSYNEPAAEYARALSDVYPGRIPVKVCYGNCGSEANDAAIKISRAYTGRKNIIAFRNGYYGSTYGAVSLTSWREDQFEAIGPKLPGTFTFPFYKVGTYGGEDPEKRKKQLEAELNAVCPLDTAAAVIIEPIQGDGGIVSADPIFLRHLYELCRGHGVLFISEEVQQGFFRTGPCFSIEHFGLVPDGIIIGKSAGGGLPLGAFIGRKEIMECLAPMAHTFTLAGNHLSCTAGLAQLKQMLSEGFQKQLRKNIRLAAAELAALKEAHGETVPSFRQFGLSIGIDVAARGGLTSNEFTRELVYRCFRSGLIVASNMDGVLRIQPPLNIDARSLKRGFEILDQVLTKYERHPWERRELYDADPLR